MRRTQRESEGSSFPGMLCLGDEILVEKMVEERSSEKLGGFVVVLERECVWKGGEERERAREK